MNHSCSRLLAIGTALLVSAAPGPAVAAVDPGPTRIVSVSDQGVAGDGASWDTRVSGDGRFIAFTVFDSGTDNGVWIAAVDTGETWPLDLNASFYDPVFARDASAV